MLLKRNQDPRPWNSTKRGSQDGLVSNAQLQVSLMRVLTPEKPMTIEEIVAAFPCEKWASIFEALAQLHRQERVLCQITESELELRSICH